MCNDSLRHSSISFDEAVDLLYYFDILSDWDLAQSLTRAEHSHVLSRSDICLPTKRVADALKFSQDREITGQRNHTFCVQFLYVRVFSDSHNVQKRATKSNTSGHSLLSRIGRKMLVHTCT